MKKIGLLITTGILALSMAACGGSDTDDTTTTTTEATTEATTVENAAPANLADGVDPNMGPQEWFDEAVFRENNCASQSIAFGGIPICEIRGTDMANGDTMLVGYVDQDRDGTQEHFEMEQRRDMFVQAFADRVGLAKYEGDPRVQHVTDVRIIATGGEGMLSGWQGEAPIQ